MLILRCSRRHGVGVFTTRSLASGTALPLFHRADWRFVRRPRGEDVLLCRRFGVADRGGYHCPKDWHRMSIGWYLNHSRRPNVEVDGLAARSTRAIRASEELTVDYRKL